ncbi:MAG TPA: hypothetical protein VGP56_01530 [Gaiellaceae bacterium]|jgi:hypothetical protein|nr:hypothetical protein [Gaiellaceae bacterium]
MNLFRSEEHVARWLVANGYEAGATLGAKQICELAHAWWGDRLAPDWQPHTLEQNQAILDSLGLTGEFWRLA